MKFYRKCGDSNMGWKEKVARMSSSNVELNRKSLQLKKSLDEVNGMLNSVGKKKSKKDGKK